MSKPNPEPLPDFAAEWMAQRRLGIEKLEQLKLESLREMTEADAARVFSQLDPPRPYELRASSGLVEQQRWFRLFMERSKAPTRRVANERDT